MAKFVYKEIDPEMHLVSLDAPHKRRARLGVKDAQLTQFCELGLWQFDYDVKPNIRLTRPGKVASGVDVIGGHIQSRQSLWCRSRGRV